MPLIPALCRSRQTEDLWGQPGLHNQFQDSQGYIDSISKTKETLWTITLVNSSDSNRHWNNVYHSSPIFKASAECGSHWRSHLAFVCVSTHTSLLVSVPFENSLLAQCRQVFPAGLLVIDCPRKGCRTQKAWRQWGHLAYSVPLLPRAPCGSHWSSQHLWGR